MEKVIKNYKRWPKGETDLHQRLKNICTYIDEILDEEFTGEVLSTEEGKVMYKEKFKELFLQTGYMYDNDPLIIFGYSHICCSVSGISIRIYIKNKDGNRIQC